MEPTVVIGEIHAQPEGPTGVPQHSVTRVNWTKKGLEKGSAASLPTIEEIKSQEKELKKQFGEEEYKQLLQRHEGVEDVDGSVGEERGGRGRRGRAKGKLGSPGKAMAHAVVSVGKEMCSAQIASGQALASGVSSLAQGFALATRQSEETRQKELDIKVQQIALEKERLALDRERMQNEFKLERYKIKMQIHMKHKSHKKHRRKGKSAKRKHKHRQAQPSSSRDVPSAQGPADESATFPGVPLPEDRSKSRRKRKRRHSSSSSSGSSGNEEGASLGSESPQLRRPGPVDEVEN